MDMDETLIERLTRVAQTCRCEGLEDVAAWMSRHLADDLRTSRPRRKRKVLAVVSSAPRSRFFIDEERLPIGTAGPQTSRTLRGLRENRRSQERFHAPKKRLSAEIPTKA
jgi:hypothetical protein